MMCTVALFHQIPGELTPLLDKSFSILTKLGKILALLLEPLSGLVEYTAPQTGGPDHYSFIWNGLRSLMSIVFPYTHPSNPGRWVSPISSFVQSFTLAYTRRVARERMSVSIVADTVGTVSGMSYRLGRAEDQEVVNLVLPVLLQGIYSKNQTAGAAYEASLKQLCFLLPEKTVETVLEKLLTALESLTESHQLHASLRLLTQLVPLLVQRNPGLIPQLLTLTLPAIDSSEPFKTVQALTFYIVLMSHLGCNDISFLEVDDIPIEAISTVRQGHR